jgi:hypothetical protein
VISQYFTIRMLFTAYSKPFAVRVCSVQAVRSFFGLARVFVIAYDKCKAPFLLCSQLK